MAKDGVKHSRPRWRLRIILVLLLLGAGVWFLPWAMTRSPLRPTLVAWCAPEFTGKVTVEEISAGWFSPLVLQGIRVADDQARPLFEAVEIRSTNSLSAIVSNSAQLGRFEVSKPIVHVVARDGGSNLEDVSTSFAQPTAESASSSLPQFEVVATDVTVVMQSSEGINATVADAAITLSHDPTAEQPLSFDARGVVPAVNSDTAPANVQVSGFVHPESLTSEVQIQTGSVSLAVLEPLLLRLGGAAEARGMLTTDVVVRYDGAAESPRCFVVGKAEGRNLRVRSERLLAGDAIDLAQFTADVDWEIEERQLIVHRQHVTSDLGALQAKGRFDLGRLLAGDFRGLLHDEAYEAEGHVDLARLANMLPGLLKVRDGVRFTAGDLKLAISGQSVEDGRQWRGQVEAANLRASAEGRNIAWQTPVAASWHLTQRATDPLRGVVSCTADFLDLRGEGTPADASLRGTCDLDRLRHALGQFLDIEGQELAGKVAVEFRLRQDPASSGDSQHGTPVRAKGTLRFDNFRYRSAQGQLWHEQRMELTFDVAGQSDASGLRRVDDAQLQLSTPSDQLRATLVDPVAPSDLAGAWPLDVSISGSLSTWYPRMRRLTGDLPLDVRRVAGSVQAQFRARLARDAVALEQAKIELSQFVLHGNGLFVQEPRVVFVGDAAWDGGTLSLRSKESTLQTSASSVRLEQIEVKQGAAGADSLATGRVVAAADLARLQRWFHDPATPLNHQWSGSLVSQADLTHGNGVTTAKWQAELKQVAVSQPVTPSPAGNISTPAARTSTGPTWQTVWSEPEVTITGQVRHLADVKRVELAELGVVSNTLELADTRGTIALSDGPANVDLSGQVVYDLQKLTGLLRPYLGPKIQLTGRGRRPFVISGPVDLSGEAAGANALAALNDMTGQAGVGWDQARVYGLPVGQGELKAVLRDRVVQIDPLDLPLGEGRFRAKSRVDLTTSAPRLLVEPGGVVEKVRISPELCQSWLKYVAPLLAEATRADGTLSVDLSRFQVPLSGSDQASMAGTVSIHSAQVRPGPVAEPLILVTRQVEAIVKRQPLSALSNRGEVVMNVPAQDIAFELRDGRVYHRNLQLTVGDVVVTTSGSVGLDSSLQMVAEVPIQEKWVARDRHLKSLAGQVVKIPLRGTLKHPKLDQRALDDLTKQMVGSAAGSFLDDALGRGINKGLEELFGR